MHRKFIAGLALILIASVSLSAQQTIRVKSSAELIRAIGSNRIIELAAGKYSLKDAYAVKNTSVTWTDAGSGHKQLAIHDVSNLTIRFSGDKGVAEIVSATPYARVFGFEDCEMISLESLTMGHEAEGPCSAGVLAFTRTQEITVSSCDLYGSGSVGLELSGCSSVLIEATTIRECTSGALWIDSSSSVSLNDMVISNNTGSYPLFNVYESQDVYFMNCVISGNSGDEFAYVGEGTENWGFEYCTITDNDIEVLSSSEAYPYFFECVISGNPFDQEMEDLNSYEGEGEGDGEYFGDGDSEFSHWAMSEVPLGFYYPSWFEIQEIDEGGVMVSDPEGNAGMMALRVYTLVKGDRPDTQAAALFKKAMLAFHKLLKEKGMLIEARIGDDFLNSEAPPYFYSYTVPFSLNDQGGYAFIKLVYSNGEVWAFAAMAENEEDLGEDNYIGGILNSIESLEQ